MNYSMTVLIGNSDNQLTQSQWASFCYDVNTALSEFKCHFHGSPPGDVTKQNSAWLVIIPVENVDPCRNELRALAKKYNQESIAIVLGNTELLKP